MGILNISYWGRLEATPGSSQIAQAPRFLGGPSVDLATTTSSGGAATALTIPAGTQFIRLCPSLNVRYKLGSADTVRADTEGVRLPGNAIEYLGLGAFTHISAQDV